MTPVRQRALVALIIGAAFFAFYLPSSVAGVISRQLSMASIAGACGLLGAIVVVSGRVAPLLHVLLAGTMLALLALFTLTAPFAEYSPGVVMLYLALALLFVADLRTVRSKWADRAFQLVTVVSLGLGYAVVADVAAVDRVLIQWYSAFYQELVSNMVVLGDKPVLTFATHSMAGFMIYLLFYAHWYGWTVAGGAWRLAAAAGAMGLLLALRSTTGLAFFVVAAVQAGLGTAVRLPARSRLPVLLATGAVAVLAAAVWSPDVELLASRARDAVVGDRIRGLASRYASDGLLAGNFAYLLRSPLSPIGFAASDTLYLGDSGFVVNLLRGSVPLVLVYYFGYWRFLRFNLADPSCAVTIMLATLAFETGFTPLQYFRFVVFLPLLVAYFNTLSASRDRLSALRPPGHAIGSSL